MSDLEKLLDELGAPIDFPATLPRNQPEFNNQTDGFGYDNVGQDEQYTGPDSNIGPRPTAINAAYRAARREFRRRCNAAGGFPTQDNQCLVGQEAIEHIEGLGENHPAYERGQQWLQDNPVDVTEDDSTQDPQGDILDGYFQELLEEANETNAGFTPDEYTQDVEESFEEDVIDPLLTKVNPNTTIGGGDANPLAGVIDDVKEKFPTWEDLWGSIKDQLPSNPKEWVDVIKGVLDAAGVSIPTGDISSILQGGYGVRWEPANTVFTNTGSGTIFVPGIPVGLPPSSVDIGTIEDLLNRPGAVVEDIGERINNAVRGAINDPIGAAGQILSGAVEVPPELWGVLLGGIEAGKDFIDWIGDTFGSDTQTPEPPLGAVVPPSEEEEGDPANRFQQLLEQTENARGLKGTFVAPEQDSVAAYEGSPQSAFTGLLGTIGAVRPEGVQQTVAPEYSGDPSSRFNQLLNAVTSVRAEEQQEDPLAGVEDNNNDPYVSDECLTFGGESCVGDTTTTVITNPAEITEDEDPVSDSTTLLSSDSGGGGGGGGESTGLFKPFMPRLSGDPELLARQQFPITDFLMGLFTGK